MAEGQGGRRSRKNHVRAVEIAELMNADKIVVEWWTDREAMTDAERRKANERDEPCHLYVDDGGKDLMVVTVRRMPKPKEMQ